MMNGHSARQSNNIYDIDFRNVRLYFLSACIATNTTGIVEVVGSSADRHDSSFDETMGDQSLHVNYFERRWYVWVKREYILK